MPSIGNRRRSDEVRHRKGDRQARRACCPARGGTSAARSGGPGKKGTAGLALLAGAAGLLMKNRAKLTQMIRHQDSSGEAVNPVESQAGPVARNSGPVAPAPAADAPAPPDHPAA